MASSAWWWVRSTGAGAGAWSDQAETREQRGDTPSNCGLWLIMIMTRLTMQWLLHEPVKHHMMDHTRPRRHRGVVTRSLTPVRAGNIGIMGVQSAWDCQINVSYTSQNSYFITHKLNHDSCLEFLLDKGHNSSHFSCRNEGTLKIPAKMLKCVTNWIIKSSQTMVALYRHDLCLMSVVTIISPQFCSLSCFVFEMF